MKPYSAERGHNLNQFPQEYWHPVWQAFNLKNSLGSLTFMSTLSDRNRAWVHCNSPTQLPVTSNRISHFQVELGNQDWESNVLGIGIELGNAYSMATAKQALVWSSMAMGKNSILYITRVTSCRYPVSWNWLFYPQVQMLFLGYLVLYSPFVFYCM